MASSYASPLSPSTSLRLCQVESSTFMVWIYSRWNRIRVQSLCCNWRYNGVHSLQSGLRSRLTAVTSSLVQVLARACWWVPKTVETPIHVCLGIFTQKTLKVSLVRHVHTRLYGAHCTLSSSNCVIHLQTGPHRVFCIIAQPINSPWAIKPVKLGRFLKGQHFGFCHVLRTAA